MLRPIIPRRAFRQLSGRPGGLRTVLLESNHPDAHSGPHAPAPVNSLAAAGRCPNGIPIMSSAPGQVEMAEAVESALADKRHLIVEAGTGTGKTLAYLVPALLSGKRIIVSTGTKNLQEQLFFKDVPFLQQHFARPLKVCYMKGRNNYACRQKIYDAENTSGAHRPGRSRRFRDHPRMGKDHRDRRPRPRSRRCRKRPPPGPRSMRARELCSGQKCPQLRALLHHADAPAGAGKRHHHRQPSPLLRRPLAEGRELRGRHPARLPRRGVRRSPRDRRRRRPVLRRLDQQLPFQDLRRDMARRRAA